MSSMHTKLTRSAKLLRTTAAFALSAGAMTSAPALAQSSAAPAAEETFADINWQPSDWDRARMRSMAARPGPMGYAISRWDQLTNRNAKYAFNDYATFLTTYPEFPFSESLRGKAEAALADEYVDPARLVAFFDRYEPMTNMARAQYALALRSLNRSEAPAVARAAWRGGMMSTVAEASIQSMFGGAFNADDQAARMDALLWQGDAAAAARQINYLSGTERTIAMARLSALQGNDPARAGLSVPPAAQSDPGYLFNRARQLRQSGQHAAARSMLVNAPALDSLPKNPTEWVKEMRLQAQLALESGDVGTAARLGDKAHAAFLPGTDISRLSGEIRDEYESLFYAVGDAALARGDARTAARMFSIYGSSQRTAPARTKGFYFAAKAAGRAGMADMARQNYEAAAAYPDQFYGQLALEALGRPLKVQRTALPQPSAEQRAAFNARPLVQASREVGRRGDWRTAVYFFRELAETATTLTDYALIAELARETGRRDMAVIAGREAATDMAYGFAPVAFPRIDVPPGYSGNWSIIHAIARQESQFATDAVSHAGARGLMQLMPGTAREQAGKMSLSYRPESLISDPQYNIRLGSAYFSRMMDTYNGSYPLAVAAYNAGPGNVNKWLRANGDPRSGRVDWVDWIESIPFTETRRYVARVLENAAYYDALYPDAGSRSGSYPLSYYLGKRPG